MIAAFHFLPAAEQVFITSWVEILTLGGLLSIAYGLFKKHNCHHHLCPRLSWHPDSTGHPICKHHHPDHPKRSRSQEWGEKWLTKWGIKKPVVTKAQQSTTEA